MSQDGLTAVIYLPNGGDVAVDLLAFEGPQVKAWWLNPRDGTNQEVGMFATGKHHTFSAPGGGDWVLALDSISHDVAPPGTQNVFKAVSTD